MLKVFIAEDQPLILKDLYKKIEKSDPDVCIVGTALNGKDAYEKIKELKPDVVFTDIRMPFLNGLEMIEQLRSEDIICHYIVISGYKDFNYARNAIKLGVADYLLKPLSFDDIKYIIFSLKEKISTEKSDYTKHMLEKLLTSCVDDYPHVNTLFHYNYYYIMTLTLGSFPTFFIDYIPHTPIEELFQINQLFSNYLEEDECYYSFLGSSHKEEIYIFCLNTSLIKKIYLLAEKILEKAKLHSTPVTLCISRKITHIENIGIENQILRAYVSQNIIFGKSGIIDSNLFSLNTKKIRTFLKEEMLQVFKSYASSGNVEKYHIELKKLLTLLENSQCSQQEVGLCIKKLFHNCFTYMSKTDTSSFELDIDEYITNSKDYEELFSFLSFLSEQLINNTTLNAVQGFDSEHIVEEIKLFMHKHYHENISINNISNSFYLTPAYFSRIFKKITGKKPIEYLTSIRMDYACNYLTSTELSIQEIAELCGYADPFYFSKLFKSTIGTSPSEYRVIYKEN